MTSTHGNTASRRTVLVRGITLAAVATTLPNAATAAPAISSGGGITGGGLIETPEHTIHFSVFGSRMEFVEFPDVLIQGSLTWIDAAANNGAGATITLVTADTYGPVDGAPNRRLLTGTATLDGEELPFALLLEDNGAPGEGTDCACLIVGEGASDAIATPIADVSDAFAYVAEGELVNGDLALIDFAETWEERD